MNKDNAKDFLPLVQALADGKTVEIRYGAGWKELDSYRFSSPVEDYRIKPEPRVEWVVFSKNGNSLCCYSNEEDAKLLAQEHGLTYAKFVEEM